MSADVRETRAHLHAKVIGAVQRAVVAGPCTDSPTRKSRMVDARSSPIDCSASSRSPKRLGLGEGFEKYAETTKRVQLLREMDRLVQNCEIRSVAYSEAPYARTQESSISRLTSSICTAAPSTKPLRRLAMARAKVSWLSSAFRTPAAIDSESFCTNTGASP